MTAQGMAALSLLVYVWILCHVIGDVDGRAGRKTGSKQLCPLNQDNGTAGLSEMTGILSNKLADISDAIDYLGKRLAANKVNKDQQDSLSHTTEQYIGELKAWADDFKTWKTTLTDDATFVNPNWRLVFFGNAGNGHSVYDAWTSGKGTSAHQPKTLKRSCAAHYRDPDISNWGALNVTRIRYVLYEHGHEVAFIEFNGIGSDSVNWFDKSRVISSSWCDLNAHGNFNIFSISGYRARRFLVNFVFAGCPHDLGHLVVIDVATSECRFDHQQSIPQFLYSKAPSADWWDRMMYGRADHLAIYVQTTK